MRNLGTQLKYQNSMPRTDRLNADGLVKAKVRRQTTLLIQEQLLEPVMTPYREAHNEELKKRSET